MSKRPKPDPVNAFNEAKLTGDDFAKIGRALVVWLGVLRKR